MKQFMRYVLLAIVLLAPVAASEVYNKTKNSIVRISYKAKETKQPSMGRIPGLQFFFEGPDGQRMQPSATHMTEQFGTGVVVSDKGHILTNHHVIEKYEASEGDLNITIGETTYTATVVGSDAQLDIAVLKVAGAKDLKPITWGDAKKVNVGDDIYSFGNSYNHGIRFAKGIVSSEVGYIPRSAQAPYALEALPVSFAYDDGDSGGGIFDALGNLIGLNFGGVRLDNQMSGGIAYGIPAYMIQQAVNDLITHGQIKRVKLGISIQPVNERLAETLKMDTPKGVLISEAKQDSHAYKAGLREGDVIVGYNGAEVKHDQHLLSLVRQSKVGDTLKLKVLRETKELTIEMKAPEGVGDDVTISSPGQLSSFTQAGADVAGLSLASITPEVRKRFNLKSDTKGVIITEFAKQPYHKKVNIQPGDIIVSIDQTTIEKVEDVKKQIENARKAGKKSVLLFVARHASRFFEAFEIAAADKS